LVENISYGGHFVIEGLISSSTFEMIFEKQDLPSFFHFSLAIFEEVILPAFIQYEVYLRLSVCESCPFKVNPQFME
jgi:hypothetical protein